MKRQADWEKQQQKFPLQRNTRSDMLLAEYWLQSEPGPRGATRAQEPRRTWGSTLDGTANHGSTGNKHKLLVAPTSKAS